MTSYLSRKITIWFHKRAFWFTKIVKFQNLYTDSHGNLRCGYADNKSKTYDVAYSVDGVIFVGTNFRGLNTNDTFVGFKTRGHSILFSKFIQEITVSWVPEFVDRTLHETRENWYPTKFKPLTVYNNVIFTANNTCTSNLSYTRQWMIEQAHEIQVWILP